MPGWFKQGIVALPVPTVLTHPADRFLSSHVAGRGTFRQHILSRIGMGLFAELSAGTPGRFTGGICL